MTRTVQDAALMLQAIAGYDAQDWVSQEIAVNDYTSRLNGDITGLRLGVPAHFFPDATAPEVKHAFMAALDVLAGLGARLEDVLLPDLEGCWDIVQTLINGEANVWHEPTLTAQPDDYGPQVRTFLQRGVSTLATDYVKAQRAKVQFRRDMLSACEPIDALLTPGALIPAPPLGARSVIIDDREVKLLQAVISATSPFNLTGQPALTVPCGMSSSGLPLALQIVGKPFDEVTVLRVGHAYEVNTPWHTRWPPVDG